MRISDWSSDVCSSDLDRSRAAPASCGEAQEHLAARRRRADPARGRRDYLHPLGGTFMQLSPHTLLIGGSLSAALVVPVLAAAPATMDVTATLRRLQAAEYPPPFVASGTASWGEGVWQLELH